MAKKNETSENEEKKTDELDSSVEITSTEKSAEDIILLAEKKADELLRATEKRIEEMLANANKPATIQNVTIQKPEEVKVGLPDYIKEMQEEQKEKVAIELFKDADRYKDDVYVAVNGKHRYQVKRGETVEVPRYIYEIEKNSQEQDKKTAELMRAKEEEQIERYKALA